MNINGRDYINSREASRRSGLTTSHITLLAKTGKLAALKYGRDWLIDEEAFAAYISKPRQGWPRRGVKAIA